MKKFIFKVTSFICLAIVLCCLPLLLPATPRASKSIFFGEIKKDSLLINVESPRIIFVGGSNVSFGINSQLIKDSLNMNPINTAITARLGLKYIFDNTNQHIKKGDIIIIMPEYQHFYKGVDWGGAYDTGSEELLRTVWDVNKSKIKLLNLTQVLNCVPFVIKFSLSKLDKNEYKEVEESDTNAYLVSSFNQYGDTYKHWGLAKRPISACTINVKLYNPTVISSIKKFEETVLQKGAILYVSYPSYQDSSFDNSIEAIGKVKEEYIKYGFTILGNPYRYRMADSLMFDTPYHLNKNGADYRTLLLIEDLKKELSRSRPLE